MTRPQNHPRSATRVVVGAVGALLASAMLVLGAGAAEAAPAHSSAHQVTHAPADTTW